MDYLISWTPAKLDPDGHANVVVSYQESRHHPQVELFKTYEHTAYNNAVHWAAIVARILSYHIGHQPNQSTLKLFLQRPTVSKAIITGKELDAFFGATDQQHSMRF